jgi:hypothetical protein
MVTITFYGNGGLTASNEDIITETVPAGTVWGSITKPTFLQSAIAKQQGGFTLVQDDDDTFVDQDFVVTSNLAVYASYTVVEFGVITYAGEIMGVNKWISKYGVNLYDFYPNDSPYPTLRLKEGARDNLIAFIYAKMSQDKAFAMTLSYHEDSALSGVGGANLGGGGVDVSANFPFVVNETTFSGGGIPVSERIYPFMHDPPDYSTPGVPDDYMNRVNNYDNGLADTITRIQALEGIWDNYDTKGSPSAKDNYNRELPPIFGGRRLYITSPYEAHIIAQNKDKILSTVNALEEWQATAAPGYKIYGGANLYYDIVFAYYKNNLKTASINSLSGFKNLFDPELDVRICTPVPCVGSGNWGVVGVSMLTGKAITKDVLSFQRPKNRTGQGFAMVVPVVDVSHFFAD